LIKHYLDSGHWLAIQRNDAFDGDQSITAPTTTGAAYHPSNEKRDGELGYQHQVKIAMLALVIIADRICPLEFTFQRAQQQPKG
jgi:hypothetical protein